MGVTTGQTVTPPKLKRDIEQGMQGLDVKACKRAAARAGFPQGLLAGITGEYTAADVANMEGFQQANGLDADGVIGKDTFAALVPHMDALALELYDSFEVSQSAAAGAVAIPIPAPFTGRLRRGPISIKRRASRTTGRSTSWPLEARWCWLLRMGRSSGCPGTTPMEA